MNLRYPETIRPMSSLCGWAVRDELGIVIGRLSDAMIFVRSGRIACAVVTCGGAHGRDERTVAVPWSSLEFDTIRRCAVLENGQFALDEAPAVSLDAPMDVADIDSHPLIYVCHRLSPRAPDRLPRMT